MDEKQRHDHRYQSDLGADAGSDEGRRSFLKSALLSGGALASVSTLTPGLISSAQAQTGAAAMDRKNHYYVPATDKTVHWGYFSKSLKPVIEMDSGDYVTIEVLTLGLNGTILD